MIQIFIYGGLAGATAGFTSFPNPGNWNPVNSVEIVGCGQSGSGRSQLGGPPCFTYGGGSAGGGGGYGRGNNRMDPFPVRILPTTNGGLWSGALYSNWGDNGNGSLATGNSTPGTVFAGNATYTANMGYRYSTGGVAGGPDVGFTGGAGGNNAANATYGGSGGGAGGPHGAGGVGSVAASALTVAGASDGGTVVAPTVAGAAGNHGAQWDNIHGTGTGGVGNTGAGTGGAGGSFGGGGAGGGMTSGSLGGNQGVALIVVTYTPLPPGASQVTIVS